MLSEPLYADRDHFAGQAKCILNATADRNHASVDESICSKQTSRAKESEDVQIEHES